jgi:hypothetical protein
MRTLKNWIRNWLTSDRLEQDIVVSYNKVSTRADLSTQGMSFTLYHAQGGYVLEWSSYDQHTDRRNTRLYIIRDDQNFAEQVAHCVTLESLRRG